MPEPQSTESLVSLVTAIAASVAALFSGGISLQNRRQLRGVVGVGEPMESSRVASLELRMDRAEERQAETETEMREEWRRVSDQLASMREVLGRIDERTKAP